MRLLQARGAPPAAAQELQAPLFQEADVHLVAGFLRGVREEGSGTLPQRRAQASPRPGKGLALGRLTEGFTDLRRDCGFSFVLHFCRNGVLPELSAPDFWGPEGAQACSHWGHHVGRGQSLP